eukprot:CAMPEP_0168359220 /NCGR_PEP_ID=MMETSP0228-20121227/1525_1 /TAXON_ID=133427 /ORGANISM="Protoceratium reticulatum, Strain CCCM 535 (=CCMP 1889)" /LENGTH=209 /DNA_ID=CAMNT_0008371833 /DNA_START=210 /DNA_END=836 /DNA_ORIENTATION=-
MTRGRKTGRNRYAPSSRRPSLIAAEGPCRDPGPVPLCPFRATAVLDGEDKGLPGAVVPPQRPPRFRGEAAEDAARVADQQQRGAGAPLEGAEEGAEAGAVHSGREPAAPGLEAQWGGQQIYELSGQLMGHDPRRVLVQREPEVHGRGRRHSVLALSAGRRHLCVSQVFCSHLLLAAVGEVHAPPALPRSLQNLAVAPVPPEPEAVAALL